MYKVVHDLTTHFWNTLYTIVRRESQAWDLGGGVHWQLLLRATTYPILGKMGTNPQETKPQSESLTLKQKLFRLKKVQNIPENLDNGTDQNQFKVKQINLVLFSKL